MLLLREAELAMLCCVCRLTTMDLSMGGCEFVGAVGDGSCSRIFGMFVVFERQCVSWVGYSSFQTIG